MILASIQLEQTDRRLLIAAIVILTLLFIVFALVGAFIRIVTIKFGEGLDTLVHDAVAYRVLDNKKAFKKYAHTKNARKFVKESTPAMLIILVSVIFYVVYGLISDTWTGKYFTEFSTVLWKWDFANEENYAVVWGVRILAKWPELTNSPHLVAEYWPSYVLSTLWIIGGTYLLFTSWAFFSRFVYVYKRASEVYKKSLEGFNYYQSQGVPTVNPNEVNNQKSGPNQ